MTEWTGEADVVVIGSGATGLPAAIVAREAGATVIVVEAEPDIGGHAITSGGNVPLGGGTSATTGAARFQRSGGAAQTQAGDGEGEGESGSGTVPVRSAESAVDVLVGRSNDLTASSGLRTEQLRIVDPGIVPQRPSFPKPGLFTGAAVVIALVLSLAYLTVLFGLSTERTRAGRPELKVARGGGR